ncbi:NAD-dependent epimerase/dehydratase family protein [Lichenihabitans sp. Uapishka_5]|uniref:NAD-dependent epimerase/dehydratase family protein n=1 Tax=Lichenihabitans sp. Uapishka_5 TaxID=3037302 RepID=UPI0029E800F9|nr:NAD-dependent epimerase/dehydratase family protein [Lichenihabitans sp. Uapishka_5]MDX7949912.1 NAD-dependent epimerase/dehydratase family protein [Lichenihabitans sp. Uapishka_5]
MLVVTGATGFVGQALCAALVEAGIAFRPVGRQATPDRIGVGEIGPDTDWRHAVAGTTAVVHLAARVHHMREDARDADAAYRRVNLEGTLALARQAHEAGVSRFVFVSSIKVNGERTVAGQRFRADDAPHPLDAYGRSKQAAEDGLLAFGARTGMEVVIVRPPLVYGPGVGANFRALVTLARRGLPLPFGLIRNKRSLIAVENLVDLLMHCITHPRASGRVWLCSDGEDISTPDLLRAICRASDVPARLFPLPPSLLQAAASLAGRGAAAHRLTESLQVDMRDTGDTLDWRPPLTMAEALARAARAGWQRL